jgi:hypothetical protein
MEVSKMFKITIKTTLIAAASVLILASPGLCLDSLIVNITAAGFMINPENSNDVRAVIRFDLPNALDSGCFISVAELRLAATVAQSFDYPLSLRINPVTTTWSAGNVDWTNPWSEPGGDYDDSLVAFGHIRESGDSDVSIDVRRLIQNYVSGRIANHGLLIRQTENLMRAFSLRQINIPGGNTYAQLAIYYIDIYSNE